MNDACEDQRRRRYAGEEGKCHDSKSRKVLDTHEYLQRDPYFPSCPCTVCFLLSVHVSPEIQLPVKGGFGSGNASERGSACCCREIVYRWRRWRAARVSRRRRRGRGEDGGVLEREREGGWWWLNGTTGVGG